MTDLARRYLYVLTACTKIPASDRAARAALLGECDVIWRRLTSEEQAWCEEQLRQQEAPSKTEEV